MNTTTRVILLALYALNAELRSGYITRLRARKWPDAVLRQDAGPLVFPSDPTHLFISVPLPA